MANIVNLQAEIGANMIGDDAEPTLTLANSSTGPSLKVQGLVASSRATVNSITFAPTFLAAAATVANINLYGASVASGAVLALKGDSMVSVTTILFTTGGVAGTNAIRIVKSNGEFGYIPVLPDSAVTAAPVAA